MKKLRELLTNRRFWLSLMGVAATYLLILMLTTTPQETGPGGVVSWFAMAYVFIVSLLVSWQAYAVVREKVVRWQVISRQALWGVGGVALVALRSLGQLQLRDTILIGLLVVILALYVRRAT